MNLHVKEKLRTIVTNIAIMMLLYSVSRLLFLFFNYATYAEKTTTELLLAFFIGLRFDLATVSLLSAPYILFSLIPFSFYFHRVYQNALKLLFFISHVPIFIFHLADIEYYKFTGSRMTSGLAALGSEIKNQLDQFIVHYWHITLASILCVFIIYKCIQTAKKPTSTKGSWLSYISFIFITMLLTLISARGGLQKKVIQPATAFMSLKEEVAVLSLNSSFTILKTSSRDQLQSVAYYPTWNETASHLVKPQMTDVGKKGQNVVVILLESFATEFWGVANAGEGYTPFLDTLASKGLFFRNHFANGRKSIEAVPSVVFGLPALMDHPLAKSKYQFNTWNGIGKQLKKEKYHTSFFHAAEKGSMYFDAVAALAELDAFYSFETYPNPKDTDGHWGIFDEPFLQYMIQELNTFQTPFFSMVFTLSSHQPYPIPEQYKDRFKKGPTPLHECIGYVDYALEQFFKEASKQSWYKDTLFIITGDHTQMSPSVNYATMLGRYMVPLLIYHPQMDLKANTDKVVQHVDILPTILDFLNIENAELNLFGRSIWQEDEGRAIFQANGIYYLVKKGYTLEFNSSKNLFSFYSFSDPNTVKPLLQVPAAIESSMKQELLAYIQYYNNGLNENKIYDWGALGK